MTLPAPVVDTLAIARANDECPLRILAASQVWQGANSYAFVRAFRRMGHSVTVIADESYGAAGWNSRPLRTLRRLAAPWILKDYAAAVVREARQLRPHLFFVFKGAYVTADAIRAAQDIGAVAVNFWPDTSISDHGSNIITALNNYDWIFTTKTFGIDDIKQRASTNRTTFLPHGFDPETHKPSGLAPSDRDEYACDASFIGAWSPKKQTIIDALAKRRRDLDIRIWGGNWRKSSSPECLERLRSTGVFGTEYAKAISATKINLAILFEGNPNAPSGDLITSRTFHIPASGGFMLHERTDEVQQYFTDGTECAMFSDIDEMIDKIDYYLKHDDERQRIAAAGRERCLRSGYSIDDRARTVIGKVLEIRAEKGLPAI